ncbi:MAG: hypothetical protein A2Y62_01530 [Candidatus Fischerbacteria bacterium RBG_13_37_8]|uniref:Metal-dependent hydrolase n=1 Tax=Candidatus Fischerbacteria bacterium RBG_13_37_8 TaxID=1817863 RepID=A0A1F5VU17_9BACT|nr:MAG: hypothetical protein A2Y62_01530 [Candidatus Fischerbacteria bacterium RBG_13_37_8]
MFFERIANKMPTPAAHTLISTTIAIIYLSKDYIIAHKKFILGFIIAISILPDIDVAWDLFIRTPPIHHTFSHSIFTPIFLSLGYVVYTILRKHKINTKLLFLFCLLYYFHLLADFFAYDLKPPYGLMLFWPFSNAYYISSQPFFLPVSKATVLDLIRKENFYALASETILLILPFLLVIAIRWRKELYSHFSKIKHSH